MEKVHFRFEKFPLLFKFYKHFCKQRVGTLIRRGFRYVTSASDLDLHCLLISHKKDARLRLTLLTLVDNSEDPDQNAAGGQP